MVDRVDQIPVMGHEDQSLASFATRGRQQLRDITCVLIVEVADWLVGENEPRIVDEGPGNRDALLLSAAQFRRPVPGAIAKTDRVEQLLGAGQFVIAGFVEILVGRVKTIFPCRQG